MSSANVEKGKRKPVQPDCQGYLVVVATASAIEPAPLYLPPEEGSSTSATRYSMGSGQWQADFEEQLRLSNIPILADYRGISALKPEKELSFEITTGEHVGTGLATTDDKDQRPAIEAARNKEHQYLDSAYEEGTRHQAERNFFRRNPKLAEQAKRFQTCICKVCGFDFAKTYGSIGKNYAEINHLNPLSERPPDEWSRTVKTDITQVAVLCANCHRMIHRRKPAFSIEELRSMFSAQA